MKIICRKCQGNHLTLNCDKNKNDTCKNKVNIIEENYTSPCNIVSSNDVIKPKITFNKFEQKNIGFNSNHLGNASLRNFRYKTFKVKITDLPNDITDNEILELLYEWGDISHVNIKNYTDTSIAYIEFKDEKQADYFIKALDKTYFEYLIISIIKL